VQPSGVIRRHLLSDDRHLFELEQIEFGCGLHNHGPRRGQPIPVNGVEPGDIAFS